MTHGQRNVKIKIDYPPNYMKSLEIIFTLIVVNIYHRYMCRIYYSYWLSVSEQKDTRVKVTGRRGRRRRQLLDEL